MTENQFEKFSLAIGRIYRYWHEIASNELKPFKLRGMHALYLALLYNHPEGLSKVDICKKLRKDKAEVTRMIEILSENKLVKKYGLYRGKYKLTAKGRKTAVIVLEKANNAVKLVSKNLTEDDIDSFYKVLNIIVENLNGLSEAALEKQEPIL